MLYRLIGSIRLSGLLPELLVVRVRNGNYASTLRLFFALPMYFDYEDSAQAQRPCLAIRTGHTLIGGLAIPL
jgi:hypothetical protein